MIPVVIPLPIPHAQISGPLLFSPQPHPLRPPISPRSAATLAAALPLLGAERRRDLHAGEPLLRLNSSPPVTTGLIWPLDYLRRTRTDPSGRSSTRKRPASTPSPRSVELRRQVHAADTLRHTFPRFEPR